MKVGIQRACLMGTLVILAAGLIGAISATAQNPAETVMGAVAILHPTEGNNVSGTVTFTQVADGVQISAIVENLTTGKHGFHIHQLGDCTAADGTSAGGHYNPDSHPHAGPERMILRPSPPARQGSAWPAALSASRIHEALQGPGPSLSCTSGIVVFAQRQQNDPERSKTNG